MGGEESEKRKRNEEERKRKEAERKAITIGKELVNTWGSMAARKSYLTRPSYVFLGGEQSGNNPEIGDDAGLEFDESQFWSSGKWPSPDHFKKPIPSSRASKKPASKKMEPVTATSLPVNIPDWSKILRDDNNLSRRKESDEDANAAEDEDEDENEDEVVSRFFCRTCSLGIVRIRRQFDIKCVVVLLLTLSIFVCALFWALPLRSIKTGFDAKDAIKLGGESLFPLFFHQI